jgi:hypothetical protein
MKSATEPSLIEGVSEEYTISLVTASLHLVTFIAEFGNLMSG